MAEWLPKLTPPTVANLKFMGLPGVCLSCASCGHAWPESFAKLKLTENTKFPEIKNLRRFVCPNCGSGVVVVSPHWPDMVCGLSEAQ